MVKHFCVFGYRPLCYLAPPAKRLETSLFVTFGLNLRPLSLSVRKRLFFVLVLQMYGKISFFASNLAIIFSLNYFYIIFIVSY